MFSPLLGVKCVEFYLKICSNFFLMMKEKSEVKTNSPLEMLVGNFIELRKNWRPIKLNDGQLSFIESNWDGVKDYFCRLVIANEMAFEVKEILQDLKTRNNVSVDDFVLEKMHPALVKKGGLTTVSYFVSDLKIPIKEEQKRNILECELKRDDLSYYQLGDIAQYLGIKISQEDADCIANKWLCQISGKSKVKENHYVDPAQFRIIMDKLGKKPRFNSDYVKEAYDFWLDERKHFHAPLFEFLREMTGILPGVEKVQNFYNGWLNEKLDHYDRINCVMLESLEKAVQITGILPLACDIKQFYGRVLSSQNVYGIQRVVKITNCPLDESVVQEKYAELLVAGNIDEIKKIEKELKIIHAFDDATVHKAYDSVLSNGNVRGAMDICALTKIHPIVSETVGKLACEKFVEKILESEQYFCWEDQEQFWNLRGEERFELQALCPVQIENVVQKKVREFVSKGNYWQAVRFISWFGVSTLPAERYVLACLDGSWKEAKCIFEDNKQSIKKLYPDYAGLMQYISGG